MMKRLRLLSIVTVFLVVAALAGCGDEEGPTGSSQPPDVDRMIGELEKLVDRGPSAFDEWVESSYRDLLLRYPETITALGLAGELGTRNDRLNDYSAEFMRDTERLDLAILGQLQRFDRETLAVDDRRTYDVCLWYWNDRVGAHRFADLDYPISHFFITSRHLVLYDLLTERFPLATPEDAATT